MKATEIGVPVRQEPWQVPAPRRADEPIEVVPDVQPAPCPATCPA